MSYYQTIYNRLRAAGLTEAGALGFLGNWDCESNCEPFRVQGDFSPYRTMSHQYTENVEDDSIPMNQFAHDAKGYGLAQWTFNSRKEGLYDYWKKSGKALDDCEMQTDFALYELSAEEEYAYVNQTVRTSNDLYECVEIICRRYERPYYENIDQRFRAANRIKAEIDLNPEPVPPEPPGPEPPGPVPPTPTAVFWPPRTIDKNCVGFPEIWVLNAILYCRGYGQIPVDTWMDDTTEAVMQFQRDSGLAADGCVGPMTWTKLLERGE
jgi:peptidoglycan hydrolase-like protein with peptidoglycan-binding domain